MRGIQFVKKNANLEHQIQKAILEYLQYYGIMAWRMNSGRAWATNRSTGNQYMLMLGPGGIPDIIGVIGPKFRNKSLAGKFIGVEVKQPGKKATDLQERFINDLKEHGAIVNVIHSIEELQIWLKTL